MLGLAKPPRAIESYDISNWGEDVYKRQLLISVILRSPMPRKKPWMPLVAAGIR